MTSPQPEEKTVILSEMEALEKSYVEFKHYYDAEKINLQHKLANHYRKLYPTVVYYRRPATQRLRSQTTGPHPPNGESYSSVKRECSSDKVSDSLMATIETRGLYWYNTGSTFHA